MPVEDAGFCEVVDLLADRCHPLQRCLRERIDVVEDPLEGLVGRGVNHCSIEFSPSLSVELNQFDSLLL